MKSKPKQLKDKKIFRGGAGSPITWEFVDKEKEPELLTRWQKFKQWFRELPIWSIK